ALVHFYPRTSGMYDQAAGLARSADERERQRVPDRGELSAGSLDELLDQVRAVDPMTIAPTLSSVREWAEPQIARVEAALVRMATERQQAATWALTLVWDKGQ